MPNAGPFVSVDAVFREREERNPWILSPALDILFCCGGLVWVLVALTLLAQIFSVGAPARVAALKGGIILTLLFSNAHTTATLIRLYQIPGARARMPFYTIILPGLMLLLGLAAFVFKALPPVLGKIYLLWNAFHWSGQAYGIALIYCYKRDYSMSALARRLLWWAINSSAFVYVIRVCSDRSLGTTKFVGIPMPFWGPLPHWLMDFAEIGTAIVLSLFLGQLAARWREDKRMFPLPALLVAGTGFIAWYSRGPLGDALWLYLVPLYHGSQYIAVTTSYFLKARGLPAGVASKDIAKLLTSQTAVGYYALLLVCGGFIYETLPHVGEALWGTAPGVALLIVTTVVNFHHFLTDAAIWKLRDKSVRDTLLA